MEFDQSLEEWAKDKPLSILQLDPADRAVLRIADERDAIQKKTFTKWVNKHLNKIYTFLHVCSVGSCENVSDSDPSGKRVGDLFEDLRDGHNLISLVEVLSGEHLPRERGRMRFHMLQNVQTVLDFLRYRKIKLVNIRAEDLVDGNPKLTLGLVWTIILHFQISDIVVGMEENVSAKDALLKWAQKSTAKYPGVRVSNFTSSWRDGLAFNAIVHRNRPELIDWRSVQRRSPRERLENAFTVAERECGVTRLLDPEDVDTQTPDEKSLITYISSLYDVFPEPPRLHPLHDTDSQKKLEEYKSLASSLYTWIRQNTLIMQDRHFSPSLIETRKLATDLNRFRVEECRAKGVEKDRLANIYRDIERHFRDRDSLEIDREIQIDNIERSWQILILSHQEKDSAVQEEIRRLEKLLRLSEKVHREGKGVEIKLDEIEIRIEEEAKRINRLHPLDAKQNCDSIERDLQISEESIKSMFNDVQVLRDARFNHYNDVQQMVQHLQQRWLNTRQKLQNRIQSVLGNISFPVEEKNVTRTTKTVQETRLVETNHHFRNLMEAQDWINEKKKQMLDSDYGSEMASVQAELDRQQREHRNIEKFQSTVDKCSSSKSHFSGEEFQLYINYLNNLQKSYTDLLISSKKRTSDLETLLDFIQSATNELSWLSEKEEREIVRDWSSKSINLVEIEHYYESLMSELEKREIQFSAVVDRGESLVLQHHPASKCIENYMSAMQTQWYWVLQLILCLETHLKFTGKYHNFFNELKECEQNLARKEELLNTVFSKSEFGLDEGEVLLKDMQDLSQELTKYGDFIQTLTAQSREIIPLKLRKTNVSRPISVTAICDYRQNNQQMQVKKDERCVLQDNSQRVRWRIQNTMGHEGMVPGVCFLIPPPDKEAIDVVERIRKSYDRIVTLWQKKQLKMRQNMIFATIRVVKSWDLNQFLAMGSDQRNAIRNALNEDAEKLIIEGDPSDPALRRLRREIDEVNRLFDEFERRALDAEKTKVTAKHFQEQVSVLQTDLEEMERNLMTKVNAPIPKDLDLLERHVMEHKHFESTMHTYESRVESAKRTYQTIPNKSSALQSKMEQVNEKWEKIWSTSNLYVERLKCVEIVLSSMDETNKYVSNYEIKLSSYDHLPIDDDGLKRTNSELYGIQNTAQSHQYKVDRLIEETKNVRKVVDKSRGGMNRRHHDIERLEDDVHRTTTRWTNVVTQIVERIRSIETTSEFASKYNTSYQSEMNWLDSVDTKTKSIQVIESGGAKRKIQPHMTLYNSVIEEKITIEQVNSMGSRLAKEAKKHDMMVAQFAQSLGDIHPSLDGNDSLVKKAKVQSAEEAITAELDILNLKYQLLVDNLYHRLQQLAVIARQEDPSFDFSVSKIPTPSPLKTYRLHMEREINSPFKEVVDEDVVDFAPKKSSATLTLSTPGSNQPTPTKRLIIKNGSEPPPHSNGHTTKISSLKFTEIRSARKIEKVEEGISTETATQVPVIIDPLTGEGLTLAQAIGCGLLDIKTGQFVDTRFNKRITLEEAVELGFLDSSIYEKLLSHCGLVDPQTGKELTLLDAIRLRLYDLSKGGFVDPITGELLTPEEVAKNSQAIRQKVINDNCNMIVQNNPLESTTDTNLYSKSCQNNLNNLIHNCKNLSSSTSPKTTSIIHLSSSTTTSPVNTTSDISFSSQPPPSLIDLVKNTHKKGPIDIDLKSGVVTLSDKSCISLPEALERGYVTNSSTSSSNYLGVDKDKDSVPQTRRKDSKSGSALSDLIDQNALVVITNSASTSTSNKSSAEAVGCELGIKDKFSDQILSLNEASDMDILNPQVVEVFDPRSNSRITLEQALAQGVIQGKVWTNPQEPSSVQIDLIQARESLLISKPLSLKDCIEENYIIEDEVKNQEIRILDPILNRPLSILQSVQSGLLDMDSKTISDVGQISGEKLVSLEEALISGIVRPEGLIQDTRTGQLLSLKEAGNKGLLSSIKRTSIFSIPCIMDCESNEYISMNEALDQGIVREGMSLDEALKSDIINPHVLSTLKLNTGIYNNPLQEKELNIFEAVISSKILPSGEVYDYKRDQVYPMDNVVENGSLTDEKASLLKGLYNINMTTTSIKEKFTRRVTLHKSEEKLERIQVNEPVKVVEEMEVDQDQDIPEAINIHLVQSQSKDIPKTNENIESKSKLLEQEPRNLNLARLPSNGWSLQEAIEKKYLNPVQGLLTIEGTDRLASFEECVQLQIIDPKSAQVIDPKNGRRISIKRSLEKNIVDGTGHYINPQNKNEKYTLEDAIKKNLIIYTTNETSENIREKSPKPSIEIKNVTTDSTTTDHTTDNVNEKTEIAEGLVLNLNSGTLIDSQSGEEINLLNAVLQGKIKPSNVQIKDPTNGQEMNINEAIRSGIVDQRTGSIKFKDHDRISLKDALKMGAVGILAAPVLLGLKAKEALTSLAEKSEKQQEKIKSESMEKSPIKIVEQEELQQNLEAGKNQAKPICQETTKSDPSKDKSQEKVLKFSPDKMSQQLEVDTTIGDPEVGNKIPEKVEEKVPVKPKTTSIDQQEKVEKSKPRESSSVEKDLNISQLDPKSQLKDPQLEESKSKTLEKEPLKAEKVQQLEESKSKVLEKEQLNAEKDSQLEESKSKILEKEPLKAEKGPQFEKSMSKVLEKDQLKAEKDLELDETRSKILEKEQLKTVKAPQLEQSKSKILEKEQLKAEKDLQLDETRSKILEKEQLKTVKDPQLEQSKSKILEKEQLKAEKDPQKDPQDSKSKILEKDIKSKNEIDEKESKVEKVVQIPKKEDEIRIISEEIIPYDSEVIFTTTVTETTTVLTKVSRMKVKPGELVDAGIVDVKTAHILSNEENFLHGDRKMSLEEAISIGKIDGNCGAILDPHGQQLLTINEALVKNILDQEGNILIPTTEQSLSLPDLLNQGLITKEQTSSTSTTTSSTKVIDSPILQEKSDSNREIGSESDVNLAQNCENLDKNESKDKIKEQIMQEIPAQKEILGEEVRKSKSQPGKDTEDAIKSTSTIEKSPIFKDFHSEREVEKEVTNPDASDTRRQSSHTISSLPSLEQIDEEELPKNLTSETVKVVFQEILKKSDQEPQKRFYSPPPSQDQQHEEHKFTFKDPESGQVLDASEAIEKNLVDPKSVILYNPENGQESTLEQVQKLQLENPKTGGNMSISDKIKLGLLVVVGAPVVAGMKAVEGLKKLTTADSKDKSQIQGIEIKSQIKPESTESIEDSADEDLVEELEFNRPWPLQYAVSKGDYNVDTGLLKISPTPDKKDEFYTTIDDAILRGEINPNALTYQHPTSGNILSLSQAIDSGLINSKTGQCTDPKNGGELNLKEALESGLLLEPSRKLSLPEAIYKGHYDPVSNTIKINETDEPVSLKKALEDKLLRTSTVLVKNFASENVQQVVPWRKAEDLGLINIDTGLVQTGEKEKMNLSNALEGGWLIEYKAPMSLSEMILKGLYKDPQQTDSTGQTGDGKFLDPKTGKYIPLIDALKKNIIDSDSVHCKDTRGGRLKKMPLLNALEEGFMSPTDGSVIDYTDGSPEGRRIPLVQALQEGDLIVDSRKPISLQKAIHQGLYSEESGKFTDPNTGKKVTVHESLRRLIINPELPCFWKEDENRILSLIETCREGIIERVPGLFVVNPHEKINLSKALEQGYILDIERPFGLYEALKIGLYDGKSGRFTHPSTGKKMTLENACKVDLIDANNSIVKDNDLKICNLTQAVNQGVVNPIEGIYNIQDKEKNSCTKVPLDEARKDGLILTVQRPLSLAECINEHLYNEESGLIADPLLGEWINVERGIGSGVIDSNTSAIRTNPISQKIKSLRAAIDDEDIDVGSGTLVLSPDKVLNFKKALEKNLISTIEPPITFSEAIKNDYIDLKRGTFFDPRTSLTCPLVEAISNELIESGSAVVKDPNTKDGYKNLRDAEKSGLIDLKKRALIDPRSRKCKPLCIQFEGGTIVFLRDPLSFDSARDKGFLNLKTGQFHDPSVHEDPISLKEAIDISAIDGHSAAIKDTKNKQIYPLVEAFDPEKGLIDQDKSTIHDTEKNHIIPLFSAVDSGLLLTPRSPLSLIQALEYNLYGQDEQNTSNTNSCKIGVGRFYNPYGGSSGGKNSELTLNECIKNGLIEGQTTVVKNLRDGGRIIPLERAINEGIIDGDRGLFINPENGESQNLVEAWKNGFLITAEARLATEAQYRSTEQQISNLTEWLTSIEKRLAMQENLKETVEEINRQTISVRQIREEVEDYSQQINTCLDQVRHLVQTGGEVLSVEEIVNLEKNGKQVKTRYERVNEHSERIYRKLLTSSDELKKYKSEVHSFKGWMEKAYRILDEKEKNISNMSASARENTKEFVSDVIAHQGDLRFITMSGQKFIEESRDYLQTLNEFRTNLPQRLPYLELRESTIKTEVHQMTKTYQELFSRANKLWDRLSTLGNKQKDFQDALNKAMAWLKEIQPRAQKLINEPIAGEPRLIEDQLARTRALQNEVLSNGRLIEAVRQATNNLLQSSEELTSAERNAVESTTKELENKYQNLLDALGDHCKDLDSALMQSQGVLNAIDNVANWLGSAEMNLKSIMKPASLIRERLDEQIREVKLLQADIDSHRPSIENMARAADDLLRAGNVNVSKKFEGKLKDILSRYENLVEKLVHRAVFLQEVSTSLDSFLLNAQHFEKWLEDMFEIIETKAVGENAIAILDELMRQKEIRSNDFAEMINSGKSLVSKKDVTDTHYVKEKIKNLENRWKELVASIEDRQKQNKARLEQYSQYERLRDQVKNWLSQFEHRISNLEPVALDTDMIRHQTDELKPMVKEHRDYNTTIEKLNDLGNAYEALLKGESGSSRWKSPSRRPSFRDSTSSTRSFSRKTSQEGFVNIEDSSPVQKELNEVNHRYDMIGKKLNDRQSELDSLREEVKKIQESLKSLAQFLDKEEGKLPKEQIPQTKEESDRLIKAIKNILENLYDKQGLLDSTKSLLGDLLRRNPNAPGGEKLVDQFENINKRWKDLQDTCKKRVAFLDTCKDFHDNHDNLNNWLNAKEKMMGVLGEIASDPKIIQNQMQQVHVMRDEFRNQKPILDSFNNNGDAILSSDTAARAPQGESRKVEDKLANLNQKWNDLLHKLDEREGELDAAKEFRTRLGPLRDWLDKTGKKLKDMSVIPTDEDKIQKRIRDHDILHDEILRKQPEFASLPDDAIANLLNDDYGKLVDDSEALRDLLKKSKAGLRHFVLSYEDLCNWMDSMDKRLNKYKILSVHKEKLLEQMSQIVDLTDEIKDREKQLDEIVESGLELMVGISNEDALQLKQKLDSLQRRFSDISDKAGHLLKAAQDALPLVTQFHDAHNSLSEWMGDVENILKTLDSASLGIQEKEIFRIEKEIQEQRKVLELINIIGPQLCHLSPGEGASTIEGIVLRDNRRFDAICEQVHRRAERIQMAKARSMEVLSDIDDLLDWFREIENQLKDAEKPSCEPDIVRIQLQEHKTLNDEITSQKGRVRDVLATVKKVLREASQGEDTSVLREKAEDLKETMESVSKLSTDRLNALEQALPLAEHFFDTHNLLDRWMEQMEREMEVLDTPAIRPDQIMKLQDKTQAFIQSLNEHRPILDKLNKTGTALMKLCNDDDAGKVDEIMHHDNERYNALRVALREKQMQLEKALQDSSQFKDQLDGLLNALENTHDACKNQEPISAHPEKIRDQIEENNDIIDDVKKREDAYNSVKKQAADLIDRAPNKNDPAVKDIKQKLDRLNNIWDQIQKMTKQRGKNLDEALVLAEKFWAELNAILQKLDQLAETLENQEPPAVEPKEIAKQQATLQNIKRDIDKVKPEVVKCKQSGQNLMKVCGEPDKPEIKKNIDELDNAWDNITSLFARREENLIDAMEKAMEFHDNLQALLNFLDKAEHKLANMGPIGSDIDAVKKQIGELKDFKADVDPKMVMVEALNRQAHELAQRTSPEQANKIKGPLGEVNRRWDNLLKGIVGRQRDLENALLRLGQFTHALNELMAWIEKTNKNLDGLKPVFGDPPIIETELAKLKVIINDIHAHQKSVDTINDAGRQIIESERGSDSASKTKQKLNELNSKWEDLQKKANNKQKDLEDALREAQAFNAEIQDLLHWLNDVDAIISASKPVGGLPETAAEQLARFMEVYNELEANKGKVEAVLNQGQQYLKKSAEGAATNLAHNLKTLKQRWESVMARANDKKIKLEIALKEAQEFHQAVQDFIDWLTEAERYISGLEPVSRVLDRVIEQVESHKEFQKEVSNHRETMVNLEKKGNHLKYFSQKQDVILIKNLLISVQHRWERVVGKTTERTRALDLGLKEAKEFSDAWNSLMKWLDEAEKSLDELVTSAGNNPQKIKQLLAKHKEFQRLLAAKQPIYDQTMRMGKNLKEKAPKPDEPILRQMLTDLKNKWNSVCNKSVERQRNLEEALLRSGQFKDAIAELMDWFAKIDGIIMEDGPVHGDLDTVLALIEQHKKIEHELEKRRNQMNDIVATGEEMMETAQAEERANISEQIRNVKSTYTKIKSKVETRSRRLEEALKEAEKLHKSVNMLLEWLSDAELRLRSMGALPDDEDGTRRLLDEHEKFMRELAIKEKEKDDTLALARSILAKAHPDAVNVIKHWISVIQSRWEEISNWAKQRQSKLQSHLDSLRNMEEFLEELMAWLQRCEDTLTALEAEPLPDDLGQITILIKEHKEFMEGMAKRQVDVDAVCKPKLIKSGQPPVGRGRGAGRLRSTTPADEREGSPDLDFGRKLSGRTLGSRETTPMVRLDSPGRERTPDLFPHIGPRFDRRGSKALEPQIKNPRVKALWDKWKHVWMMAWERQRRLQDKYNYLLELEKVKNFSWDDWRKRFLKYNNYKKSRVTDIFRKIDRNNNCLIPREEFIDAIIKTKFPTSRLEMNAVADMFDHGDHLIDYMEFIAALRPDWEEKRPVAETDIVDDEIQRQVMKCTCRQKFRVFQVGEGKYRFGDSQKLRLVRILRSTVMVRVGGGWVALDEFLVKNDPCRAKGRTNIELREQFILADGVSQSMTAFKSKASGSASSQSRDARSSSSLPAAGPITKVKEKSIRSVPMGSNRARSTDRTTPDSTFSDEGFLSSRMPRQRSAGFTPGRGSTPGSRTGSKPPSRAGSNVSLDSTDELGRSGIPVRRSTSLKRGSSGSGFGGRPQASSTPISSRAPFSLNTNLNGASSAYRGSSPSATQQRALSFTRPSTRGHSAQRMQRTGSASSLRSLPSHSTSQLNNSQNNGNYSGSRPPSRSGGNSKIPVFVGGGGGGSECGSTSSRTPSRTPSTSNIPVLIATSNNSNANTPQTPTTDTTTATTPNTSNTNTNTNTTDTNTNQTETETIENNDESPPQRSTTPGVSFADDASSGIGGTAGAQSSSSTTYSYSRPAE